MHNMRSPKTHVEHSQWGHEKKGIKMTVHISWEQKKNEDQPYIWCKHEKMYNSRDQRMPPQIDISFLQSGRQRNLLPSIHPVQMAPTNFFTKPTPGTSMTMVVVVVRTPNHKLPLQLSIPDTDFSIKLGWAASNWTATCITKKTIKFPSNHLITG